MCICVTNGQDFHAVLMRAYIWICVRVCVRESVSVWTTCKCKWGDFLLSFVWLFFVCVRLIKMRTGRHFGRKLLCSVPSLNCSHKILICLWRQRPDEKLYDDNDNTTIIEWNWELCREKCVVKCVLCRITHGLRTEANQSNSMYTHTYMHSNTPSVRLIRLMVLVVSHYVAHHHQTTVIKHHIPMPPIFSPSPWNLHCYDIGRNVWLLDSFVYGASTHTLSTVCVCMCKRWHIVCAKGDP